MRGNTVDVTPACDRVEPAVASPASLWLDCGVWLGVWLWTQSPARAWLAVVSFRLAVVLNSLCNEWGHLTLASMLANGKVWSGGNALGHRPLWTHLAALVPFTADRRGELWVRVPARETTHYDIIRVGGWFLGATTSLISIVAAHRVIGVPHLTCAYAAGVAFTLCGAALSDLLRLGKRDAGVMACGNVTLMGALPATGGSPFPAERRSLLEAMLRISQMRGAQSGGGAVQVEQGGVARSLIRKCVNSKRGDLARLLTRALTRETRLKRAHQGSFIVQTHVRYATAGITKREEAHPFRYIEVKHRGLRRVFEWSDGRPICSVRPVETTLTHNGDMDGLKFRGVHVEFSNLGVFLEHLLGVKNRWLGDSPLLAGAIELFVTRGLWFESLRLAYHTVVAPAPPRLDDIPIELRGRERETELRRRLAQHPTLSPVLLQQWEARAERVFVQLCGETEQVPTAASENRRFREDLAERLVAEFARLPELPPERTAAFARAAVGAFFDNDLYIALRKLEPGLDGTFGCVVTSTLQPGTLVAFSRGQPLSLGFSREEGLVCVVSERSAMKVIDAKQHTSFDERLDLDLCRGEIARVEVDGSRRINLTLYGISDGSEYDARDLVKNGRLVPLVDNRYVSPLPIENRDRLGTDIAEMPRIVREARDHWRDPQGYNAQTALALSEALFTRRHPRLLLLGITNDLWLAEQFANNLRLLLPAVEVVARSSNEILVEEPRPVIDDDTVVLAISQTGQDFPTLGALLLLQASRPGQSDAFFALTGEIDTLMGQAVGQSYAREANFSRRVFASFSGFRPTEAAILTVNAMQLALDELLLFLGNKARELGGTTGPMRLGIDAPQLDNLRARCDALVEHTLPAIVDPQGSNAGNAGPRRLSRRWALHVLEGIFAFALAVVVLELNLRFDAGVLPSSLLRVLPDSRWLTPVRAALEQADVAFYAFLVPLFVWLQRLVQHRPVFHRQGPRELLIGDTRYVHRIVWLLSRKLFSLSYGFASLKPYAADAQDDLILTHEPTRGSLVLIGLPDARRAHLGTRAGAALMSAKQLNNSRSLGGSGAEIITIGHAPAREGSPGVHWQLPGEFTPGTSRAQDLLHEGMFDSWERLLGMQVFLERVARHVSTWAPLHYDRSRTKDQVFAPTTAAPVSAAAIYQLLSRSSERYQGDQHAPLPFDVVRSDWRGSAPKVRTSVWRRESSVAPKPPTQ